MRARWLWLFGAVALIGAACAKGSALNGGSTQGGGDGGGGGEPAGTTTGGGDASSTTTGPGSGGGGGNACSEQPCKLVEPQCGCPAGEQCTLTAVDGTRGCVAAGTSPQGAVCTGDECAPGHICLGTTPTISTCLKFCDTDAECEAPGGICYFEINDGSGGTIPDVTLCTDNCDPASNTGCASGTACQLAQVPPEQQGGPPGPLFTLCGETGTGVHTSACTDNGDCAPTFACTGELNMQTVCLKWCKVGQAGNCPTGQTCSQFDPALLLGSTEYGACL